MQWKHRTYYLQILIQCQVDDLLLIDLQCMFLAPLDRLTSKGPTPVQTNYTKVELSLL